MSEQSEQLKKRTMRFALDVCALIKKLPYDEPGPTAKRQLAKAATSVAFNYRASCRARSHAEFTAKIGVVSEESDESQGWLEFIEAAGLMASKELSRVQLESTELCAIFSASAGTARNSGRK
jgi:four helix bundle protein